MDWKISVLIYVLTYSLSVIIQSKILKEDNSEVKSRSVFFQLSTGILLIIYGLVVKKLNFLIDWNTLWPNILFMTIVYTIGNIYIFKSLQTGLASSFSVYFSLRVFVNLVLSYFFFSQTFSILNFVGLILLIVGIVIVDYSSKLWKISKSELYAILAAVCIGATNANAQFVLEKMTLETFLVLVFIFPVIFMTLWSPKTVLKIRVYLVKSKIIIFFVLALFYTAASIFFFKAIQDSNNSSLVTAIGLLSTVVTVILSFIFLRERKNFLRRFVASVISFIGLLLLI